MRLPLAKNKTNLIHFGNKNPNASLIIDGSPINPTTSVRDLGVTISNELKFHEHIFNIVKRANQRANLILRSFSSRSPSLLKRLFIVYVRPILEYASPLWSPSDPHGDVEYVNLLESVQRRFTQNILKRSHFFQPPDYAQRLKLLTLETLELRRFYIDLCYVYNIVNNHIDLPFDEFFRLSSNLGRTRSHNDYKLTINRCNLNKFKYFFSNRVLKAWNSLPQYVVSAPSVHIFKARLRALSPQSIGFESMIKY